jgi:hypothetical protein
MWSTWGNSWGLCQTSSGTFSNWLSLFNQCNLNLFNLNLLVWQWLLIIRWQWFKFKLVNIFGDMWIDGSSTINVIIENPRVQLGLSNANQTISKAFGFIKDLKLLIYGIPCTITFIFNINNVLDSSYSMLLRCPWLRDSKVSHD